MNLSNIKNVPNSREELVLHLQIKQLVTYLMWDHFDKEWNVYKELLQKSSLFFFLNVTFI